jgi:hypothetical protein
MDDKLLGLIGVGVVAYLILNKKDEEIVAITSNEDIPTPPIVIPEPPILTREVIGCMDPTAIDYDPLATIPHTNTNGVAICNYGDPIDVPVLGCTDPISTNYNPLATVNDSSCAYPTVPTYGCTDVTANNYDVNASDDDASCQYTPLPIQGCTDQSADNFNSGANLDDGSCSYTVNCYPQGCVSAGVPQALQSYSGLNSATCPQYSQPTPANCGNLPVSGCTDPAALNYNPVATTDCFGNSIYNAMPLPGLVNQGAMSSFDGGGQFMIGNY